MRSKSLNILFHAELSVDFITVDKPILMSEARNPWYYTLKLQCSHIYKILHVEASMFTHLHSHVSTVKKINWIENLRKHTFEYSMLFCIRKHLPKSFTENQKYISNSDFANFDRILNFWREKYHFVVYNLRIRQYLCDWCCMKGNGIVNLTYIHYWYSLPQSYVRSSAFPQTIFSVAFSWMISFVFW